MTRGDIVYVHNDVNKSTGSEWSKDRPAIVVSNDMCNKYSPVIEVVFTTTSRRKHALPTHVVLKSTPVPSTALCESIYIALTNQGLSGSLDIVPRKNFPESTMHLQSVLV